MRTKQNYTNIGSLNCVMILSKLEKMFSGLVIAIEPMIVMGGTHEVVVADNKWDISSKDNSLTAHFEHTVAVTEDSYKIITAE